MAVTVSQSVTATGANSATITTPITIEAGSSVIAVGVYDGSTNAYPSKVRLDDTAPDTVLTTRLEVGSSVVDAYVFTDFPAGTYTFTVTMANPVYTRALFQLLEVSGAISHYIDTNTIDVSPVITINYASADTINTLYDGETLVSVAACDYANVTVSAWNAPYVDTTYAVSDGTVSIVSGELVTINSGAYNPFALLQPTVQISNVIFTVGFTGPASYLVPTFNTRRYPSWNLTHCHPNRSRQS